MTESTRIEDYEVSLEMAPRMWKAKRAFTSAEMLRHNERFCGAANRYYYATVHVTHHYFGRGPREELVSGSLWERFLRRYPERGDDKFNQGKRYWRHGELWTLYEFRFGADLRQSMSEANKVRNKADYSPAPVRESELVRCMGFVEEMLKVTFEREGIDRRSDS